MMADKASTIAVMQQGLGVYWDIAICRAISTCSITA